ALVIGLVFFMTLAGVALAILVAVSGEGALAWGDRIAVIEIDGLIDDERRHLEQIRKFREDPSVKGFLVSINSPGGVVGASQSIYWELRRIREDGRPVIATIGDIGASGGYYIALAADSIFALPGSITGSIGVVMEFPDVSELMRKVGVDMHVVKSAEHKDTGSPFRPLSPGDRAVVEELVQDVYSQFVDVVAEERGLSADEVRSLADGRILSGRQAYAAGLVDRIGNRHDALAAAGRMAGLGDDPRVVRPPKREFPLLDLLLGRGATSGLTRWIGPLEGYSGPRLR